MTESDLRFTEIEHKYVVEARFDLAAFDQALTSLGPTRRATLQVRDRYFLPGAGKKHRFLIRHRFDPELHHLTLKTLEDDPQIRTEVNLDLGHHAGDQTDAVDAFLAPFEVEWQDSLLKDLDVWYFHDAEVVYYRAEGGGRVVRCVEFEATRKEDVASALAVLERYENASGLGDRDRERRSLPELLFPEVAAVFRR